MYGEVVSVLGPPPHARGAPLMPQLRLLGRGTTPARARTTGPSRSPGSRGRDHPRTRGDHTALVVEALRREGPPPHARGPPLEGVPSGTEHGATPARAGTTVLPGSAAGGPWDHPRTRGEHKGMPETFSGLEGPPPHARGAPRAGDPPAGRPGTTPARVGSTRPGKPGSPRKRDHPRTRGEHLPLPQPPMRFRGPPPHARGAPFVVCGFIRPRGRFWELLESRAYVASSFEWAAR